MATSFLFNTKGKYLSPNEIDFSKIETIGFDIDHTLIDSEWTENISELDFSNYTASQSFLRDFGDKYVVVHIRPYVTLFLDMCALFGIEIYAWSNGSNDWVEFVIDKIFGAYNFIVALDSSASTDHSEKLVDGRELIFQRKELNNIFKFNKKIKRESTIFFDDSFYNFNVEDITNTVYISPQYHKGTYDIFFHELTKKLAEDMGSM